MCPGVATSVLVLLPPCACEMEHCVVGVGLLGWPRGSPNAAVHVGVGWPDAQRLVTGRLLSLYGRLNSFPKGHRSPLLALVFRVMSAASNTLSTVCNALRVSLQITTPTRFGVGPGCSARQVREWFAECVVPPLDRTPMTSYLPQLPPLPSIMWISGRSR